MGREKVLEAVENNADEMNEEKFKRLISKHKKELENSGNKQPDDRKKQKCWCCGENTHRKDKCPNREKAFCSKCNTRGHFDRPMAKEGKYKCDQNNKKVKNEKQKCVGSQNP